jgi:hypothetical protein
MKSRQSAKDVAAGEELQALKEIHTEKTLAADTVNLVVTNPWVSMQ